MVMQHFVDMLFMPLSQTLFVWALLMVRPKSWGLHIMFLTSCPTSLVDRIAECCQLNVDLFGKFLMVFASTIDHGHILCHYIVLSSSARHVTEMKGLQSKYCNTGSWGNEGPCRPSWSRLLAVKIQATRGVIRFLLIRSIKATTTTLARLENKVCLSCHYFTLFCRSHDSDGNALCKSNENEPTNWRMNNY